MRSTGFYLARPTHDGVPRQAGRQGHGSDTSPTQIIGFARGPLSAHSLIHQPRQRPVFIPYPLDDGFVLREGMFLHITTAGNTYLIMLLFRGSLVLAGHPQLIQPPDQRLGPASAGAACYTVMKGCMIAGIDCEELLLDPQSFELPVDCSGKAKWRSLVIPGAGNPGRRRAAG